MVSRRSRIFLKLETLQPSGSFKSRGLGNLVLKAFRNSPTPDKLHFFAASGGNAGLGCVHAANFVGQPATVVVPTTTRPAMIEKLYAAGARDVLQHGANIQEASLYVHEVVMPQARAAGHEPFYVDPFDHPDIWHGHSSLVDELAQQLDEQGDDDAAPAPDWIICSCGGGGLFNGIMAGIARQPAPAWESTRVLAVETDGAHSLAHALARDERAALPAITSMATSLGCVRVSAQTWDLIRPALRTGRARNVVLSDAEAALGCWKLAEDERIMVEAACGVNVALCYGGRLEAALGRPPRPDETFVIVLCGGSNVSTETIEGYKREYAHLLEPDVVASRRGSEGETVQTDSGVGSPASGSVCSEPLTDDGPRGAVMADFAAKRPRNVIIC
jgi:L-serine/L-threonine ammonia-lyase